MNNLELEGTLMKILPAQRGTSARGEWVKQEFLVEYQDGRFPVTAVFSVWGQDKVDELASFSVGDLVSVAFKVSSREYAGKYYTDLSLEDRPCECRLRSGGSGPAGTDGISAVGACRIPQRTGSCGR